MSIINTKGEIKNKKKSITNYTYYVSNYIDLDIGNF